MELVVALSVLAGLAVAMFAIYCRLFRVRARLPLTAQWIDELSVERSDFQRISLALKIVMVQSRYDRPDLAAALVRSRWAFVWCMVWVYCRLTLYRFGLASVEVAALLKVFDRARLELRSLVPAQAGLSVSCP